jgi:hypothetical protein
MTDPDARKTLLGIAASYDALAKHAERRASEACDRNEARTV